MIATLLTMMGCARGIPQMLELRSEPPLEDTLWMLVSHRPDLGTTRYEVAFKPEGELVCYNERDTTADDRWVRRGARLKLLINNGHVEYRGRFVDSEHVEGEAMNVDDRRWPFELERVN